MNNNSVQENSSGPRARKSLVNRIADKDNAFRKTNHESSPGAQEEFYANKASVPRLGYKHWLIGVSFITLVCVVVRELDWNMPDVVPASHVDEFSEARARKWLEELVRHGSRVSGSHNAEVIARGMIIDSLEHIKSVTAETGVHKIEYSEQRPSGCFDLGFLSSFTLCYRKVLNIIVRFGPKSTSPTKDSVLVSCHFDSVSDGPGATDDAVSCAIMLDILLVLAHRDTPIENDFIFLFNGAEENFLQAAHGFITSHPWRHSIRAFVNLEGAGAGGRELLFQAGPGNAWLIKAYIEAAPHPHCSVMAQEVFQTGIVPSDTDFRIFRDYGRVPGLDIAYARNGYVYHTEFDETNMIDEGAIQRAGENVMGTLLNLIKSPYLSHPGEYHEGEWVFFDVAGLFNIFYPLSWGICFNYLTSLAVFVKILSSLLKSGRNEYGKEDGYSLSDFLMAVCVHMGTSAVVVVVMIGMTYVVNLLGLSMVWYARHYHLIPLYVVPGLASGFSVHAVIKNKFFAKRDPFVIEQAFFDATLAIAGVILFLMTWFGLASAFLALIHTAFPLFREFLRRVFASLSGKNDRSPLVIVSTHLLCVLPAAFIASLALLICVEFFLPMMGRIGQHNPEFVVAILSALGTVSPVLYFSSWIYASRNIRYLICSALWMVALCVFLMLTTSFGHPFVYSPTSPRLRRVHFQHIVQNLYNEDDSLRSSRVGMFATSMDWRGVEDLPEHAFFQGATPVNCTGAPDSYCSMPYYVPVYSMFPAENMIWLSVASAPSFPQPIKIGVTTERENPDGTHTILFSLEGPDHLTVFITPVNSWKLESWSFTNGGIDPDLKTYFVFLAYAQEPGPWKFSLTFRNSKPSVPRDSKKVVIGVGSHYLHGESKNSPQLDQLFNLIKERRETPGAAVGWWKWAITPNGFISEYISKYF